MTVLSLADEGKVDLDAKIAEYLPNIPGHSSKITVRHLLLHTSGIPGRNTMGRGDDINDAIQTTGQDLSRKLPD